MVTKFIQIAVNSAKDVLYALDSDGRVFMYDDLCHKRYQIDGDDIRIDLTPSAGESQ